MTGALVRRLVSSWFVVAALLGPATSDAGSFTVNADGVAIEVSRQPDPPRAGGKTSYTVRLVATGAPVTGAQVLLTGRMADGMAVVAPLRPGGEAGVYEGDVLFTMAGPWELRLRLDRASRRLEVPFREEVKTR